MINMSALAPISRKLQCPADALGLLPLALARLYWMMARHNFAEDLLAIMRQHSMSHLQKR
jgi:hypothetical protein